METASDLRNDPRWDVYMRDCPCREVLDLVASKWSALVLGALAGRAYRFGELRRRVDGISQKVLTQTLRQLERDGLVTRTVYPTTPPSVEYALAELGRDVTQHLIAISEWSKRNYDRIVDARQSYDARTAERAPV
ncbi:HxlR family transcriptional regulator [Herbihabitans rhizosphaerae]|uniref:HxlR family transcriptional regulator n=1 Tax=Herbihabitans rhizosphaerae TaxID=1872711 RepID=A0A4Q7KWI3_9PSEU|nr:helix-turn-helix domain-containing protein [Herbihabitans rhizosphaerae]RZS41124.1 HxlR family transcriptional regulator [Herbihabitans rhizosphaerae]